MVFIIVRILDWIIVVLIVWKFEYCAHFAWKCLFTAQNMSFWGIWPKIRCNMNATPKRHILVHKHVIWHIDCPDLSNGCWDIMIFYFLFQDGGHPPSLICGTHFRMTHKDNLVVFITGLILVWIALVVLMVECLNVLQVWLTNAYSRPPQKKKCWFSGHLTTKMRGSSIYATPQKAFPCTETRHMTHKSSKLVQ